MSGADVHLGHPADSFASQVPVAELADVVDPGHDRPFRVTDGRPSDYLVPMVGLTFGRMTP